MSSVRFSPVLMVIAEQPALRQCAWAASPSARPIPPRRTDASTASIPKYPALPSTRTSTAPTRRPSSSVTRKIPCFSEIEVRTSDGEVRSPRLNSRTISNAALMMRTIWPASDTVAWRIFIGAPLAGTRRWCAAMKPYVICHMCTTVDGRVLSRRAAAPLGHVTGCRVGMKVSDRGRRRHEHPEPRGGACPRSVGQVAFVRTRKLVEAAGIEEIQTGCAKPFARRELPSHPTGAVHEDPSHRLLPRSAPYRPPLIHRFMATARQRDSQRSEARSRALSHAAAGAFIRELGRPRHDSAAQPQE